MKQFNVSRRLTVQLGAFGIVTALAVGVFVVLLRQSLATSSRVAADATTQLGRSYTLLQSLADTHSDLQRFIRLKDPDEMEKALNELQQRQEEARELIAADGAGADSLTQKYDTLRLEQKAVIEEVLRGNVADAYDKFFSRVGTEYESLLAGLSQQNEKIQSASKDLLASHSARSQRSMFWQTAIVAFVLAGLIAFGWRLKQRIVGELRRLSGVIDESSTQLASAIGQISANSQVLAEGASEQAASLQETSASLEEMSSMTKRNAENAVKANELARQARTAADQGAADMQDMSVAMESIKTSSDDIAKIIKTINEIAFQTNILALNAAVEAARAGEAGMGFAVVADEVRNLAQRSAQAAKETAAKIEGAIAKTANGVEISTKVAQVLNDIVAKARQVDELVAEVATASREQTNGILQINTAVTQMDKVTQSNASNAEESASAGEELTGQAESLKAVAVELQELVGAANRATSGRRQVQALVSCPEGPASTAKVSGSGRGRENGVPPAAKTKAGHACHPSPSISSRSKAPTGEISRSIPFESEFKDF